MRKTQKPYIADVGGKLIGFFKTQKEALAAAEQFRTNWLRSTGTAHDLKIKITYDQAGEVQRTVHEE